MAHRFRIRMAGCGWLLASWLGGISLAFGQQDGLEEEFQLLEEEQVVYSAAKHEQYIGESPSAITVITRDQIENSFCDSLTCLLSLVPEMDVLRTMPMHTQVDARHISGEDKVLLLIDGRELNLEFIGPPVWEALPIHVTDIERIEVIRGPGSALYGANAFAAVVSVTTRKSDSSGLQWFLQGGERGVFNIHLRLDQTWQEWKLHVSGGRESADNWERADVTERIVNRIRLRFGRETSSSSAELELGFNTVDGLLYTNICPSLMESSYQADALATYRSGALKSQLWFNIFRGVIHPDLPLFYQGIKLGEMAEQLAFFATTLDGSAQYDKSFFDDNLLVVGGNYRWLTYLSPDNDPEQANQHRVGIFLQDEQKLLDQLTLTGGVRFDYNTITPFTVSPRIAVIWNFLEDHYLRLGFGKAFRKPTFINTSFHIKGVRGIEGIDAFFRRSFGNEELGNENITTWEAGYLGRFLGNRLSVEATLFFGQYRDSIRLFAEIKMNSLGLPDLSKSTLLFQNAGDPADSLGASIALTYNIHDRLWLTGNAICRYSVQKTERTGWEPACRMNLDGNYVFQNGLHFGLTIQGASSSDHPTNESPLAEVVIRHLPSHLSVSGVAAWRLKIKSGWVEVGLRSLNLLNMGYRDTPQVPRTSGDPMGGERIGRLVQMFLQAAL